jgi:hypothetical protein
VSTITSHVLCLTLCGRFLRINDVMLSVLGDFPINNDMYVMTSSMSIFKMCRYSFRTCSRGKSAKQKSRNINSGFSPYMKCPIEIKKDNEFSNIII